MVLSLWGYNLIQPGIPTINSSLYSIIYIFFVLIVFVVRMRSISRHLINIFNGWVGVDFTHIHVPTFTDCFFPLHLFWSYQFFYIYLSYTDQGSIVQLPLLFFKYLWYAMCLTISLFSLFSYGVLLLLSWWFCLVLFTVKLTDASHCCHFTGISWCRWIIIFFNSFCKYFMFLIEVPIQNETFQSSVPWHKVLLITV